MQGDPSYLVLYLVRLTLMWDVPPTCSLAHSPSAQTEPSRWWISQNQSQSNPAVRPCIGETLGVKENSLSDMNSMDIVLGFHVNLDPVILVAGVPISADLVVDDIIEATVVLVPG